jgi:hypothetical protein
MTMSIIRIALGVLFLALLAPLASARITVSATNGGTYTLTHLGSNVYELTLVATSTTNDTKFTIRRSTSGDVLNFIHVDSENIGRVTYLDIGTIITPIAEIKDISLLDDDGYTSIIALWVNTLRDVKVNSVAGSHIYGNLIGPVLALGHPDNPGFLNLYVDGNVTGDIVVDNTTPSGQGELESLVVIGSIGTATAPVEIICDDLISVIQAGEINANIHGDHNGGYIPFVERIRAVTDNSGSGIIRGSMQIESFATGGTCIVESEGEMRGTIYLSDDLANPSGGTAQIKVPADGLVGRILVNTLNGGGVWTAPVVIGTGGGTITLDGDTYADVNAYPNSAASIGDGTVGVGPYKLHRTDCFPAHDSVVDPSELTATNLITMRHYGPVYWNPSDGYPYEVHRRKTGSSDSWQLQDCFTCEMDNNETVVWVKSAVVPQRGFEYRVQRRLRSGDSSNVLRCKLPHLSTSEYPEVHDSDPLVFKVCNETYFPSAPGDADDNGIVNAYDVDSVLENWSSTDCMKYGDADRSGAVNGVDLDIAELYLDFEYCYEAPSSFSKTADGFAQMDLDQDPAAMSEPMTLTQPVQYMGYEDTADFAAGFDAMEAPARAAARAVLMALISGD